MIRTSHSYFYEKKIKNPNPRYWHWHIRQSLLPYEVFLSQALHGAKYTDIDLLLQVEMLQFELQPFGK